MSCPAGVLLRVRVCVHVRIVNILLVHLWKISYLTELNNINLDFCVVCFLHKDSSQATTGTELQD